MKKKKHFWRKICALILTVLAFVATSSFSISATSAVKDTEVVIVNDKGEKRTVSHGSFDTIKKAETSEEIEREDIYLDDDELEEMSRSAKRASEDFDKNEASSAITSDVLIVDDEGNTVSPSFNKDWSLILVNKEHLIPEDYRFRLATVSDTVQTDVRVAGYLADMIKAARSEGISLYVASSYRDLKRQTYVFNRKINELKAEGYDEDEAFAMASEVIAIPGSSEHSIGLAVDLVTAEHDELDEAFAYTDGGRWLAKNAPDYGFILRYPRGKEDITKIEFEPWHYRFVGVEAAKEITEMGLCLEEYDRMIGLIDDE